MQAALTEVPSSDGAKGTDATAGSMAGHGPPSMRGHDLGERVKRTLALAESREYNLTLERLSTLLMGGPAEVEALRETILSHEGLEFDGIFVGLRGRLRSGKCARRKQANGKWLPAARGIAQQFARDLTRICPHVKCVMLAGSAASGGFSPEDDIDLNIVVRDGTKYTSYFAALLLSLEYSLRYGRHIGGRYLPGVPKVICINVVWEEGQVIPFARRDEQLAFELLNSVVILDRDLYGRMLDANPWVAGYFPQILSTAVRKSASAVAVDSNPAEKPSRTVESLSRKLIFVLHDLVWGLRGNYPRLRERMLLVEKVKRPYGIFDVPPGGTGGRA